MTIPNIWKNKKCSKPPTRLKKLWNPPDVSLSENRLLRFQQMFSHHSPRHGVSVPNFPTHHWIGRENPKPFYTSNFTRCLFPTIFHGETQLWWIFKSVPHEIRKFPVVRIVRMFPSKPIRWSTAARGLTSSSGIVSSLATVNQHRSRVIPVVKWKYNKTVTTYHTSHCTSDSRV